MQSIIRLLNKSKVCESYFCVGAAGSTEGSTELLLGWYVDQDYLAVSVASLACNSDDKCEEEREDANSKYHEQNKSRQNCFGCQILNLVKVISNMGNPFKEQSLDLLRVKVEIYTTSKARQMWIFISREKCGKYIRFHIIGRFSELTL